MFHGLNSSLLDSSDFGHHLNQSTSTLASSRRLISEIISYYFDLILDFWIVLLINLLGIVTNVINIIVFHRQGFQETVNISLAYIAVWDLIKSVAGVILRFHGPLSLASLRLGFVWDSTTWPYLTFISLFSGYVTYGLVTYVSVARCLCVVIPFKVKFILNRRFTLIMVNVISLVVFDAYSVTFSFYSIVYEFNTYYNMSLPSATCNNLCHSHPGLNTYFKFMSITLPSVCFLILCISSAVTITYLRKSLKIHNKLLGRESDLERAAPKVSISRKEAQVAKTVLTVIGVYICNLFPRIFGNYLPSIIEPEYYVRGGYEYLYIFVANMVSALDAINSSINLFIFVSMSTNFKTAFYEVFPACKKKMSIQ